jgi:hypothetical protein
MTKHITRAALAAAAVLASLGPAATAQAATKCEKANTEIVGGSSADRQVAVTACRAPGRHAPQSTKGWREYGMLRIGRKFTRAADRCITKIRTVSGPDSDPEFSPDPITGDCRNALGLKGGHRGWTYTYFGDVHPRDDIGQIQRTEFCFELRKGARRIAGRCAWSRPVRGRP